MGVFEVRLALVLALRDSSSLARNEACRSRADVPFVVAFACCAKGAAVVALLVGSDARTAFSGDDVVPESVIRVAEAAATPALAADAGACRDLIVCLH